MFIKHLSTYFYITLFIVILFTSNDILAKSAQKNSSINFKIIKKYADLANIAYKPTSSLKNTYFLKGYTLTHHKTIDDIGISYFLITNDINKSQSIAIRGTANVENTIANLSVKLIYDKHTGIYLHRGFLLTAQAIYAELKPYLIKDYTINTTGHSLGGAVALILAMSLDKDKFKIGKVITFGQPKITNLLGAYKFQHLSITRVVTQKDLVPLVPFIDPMDINDLDIYWHQGKEIVLLSGNNYSILEGMKSMLRATKFTQETLSENNFTHHQMVHYLKNIKQKIPSSDLIPFKNNFNIFNLFTEKSNN
jgi:predicted lipase